MMASTDMRTPFGRSRLELPRYPVVTNQTAITGPKTLPTFVVPFFWKMNSVNRIPSVAGTTIYLSAGVITSRPSVAPRTEIAGVITPSP